MILGIKNYLASNKPKQIFFDFGLIFFAGTLPLWTNINTIALWVFIAGSLAYVTWSDRKNNFNKNKIAIAAFTMLYLLYVFSLIYTDNISFGLRKVEKTLTLFLIPMLVLTHNREDFKLKFIYAALGGGLFSAMTICWGAVFYSIATNATPWVQLKYFFQWIYSSWNLVKPLDGHPSYIAVLLVIFIFALLQAKSFARFRKGRVKVILILLPLLVFLIQTSSRVALVALVILIFLYTLKRLTRKNIILFGTAIILISALSYQFDFMSNKFDKILNSRGKITFERYERWTNIMKGFGDEDALLFGIGAGDVNEIYETAYLKGRNFKAIKENYNAHNQFVETLVGLGLLGLFSFIALFVLFAYKTRLEGMALPFFVVFLLFAFFESILERSQGVFMFAFLFSVLYLIFQKDRRIES